MLTLDPFMVGMPDITTSILSLATGPSANPGVGPVGTIAPYLVHRFGSGHIPTSTPFVGGFSLPSSCLNNRDDSGYMNVGATTYIPSYVPSSTTLIPSSAFLMSNPPYILHGPSRSGAPFNYVVPSSAGAIVFVSCLPPHMSGGQPTYQSHNYI